MSQKLGRDDSSGSRVMKVNVGGSFQIALIADPCGLLGKSPMGALGVGKVYRPYR